jgi:two-component system C4-dicarboxylate transport response regulator DctD
VAERFTLGMPTRVDAASSGDNTEKPSLETKLNLFERQLIEEALRGCSGRTAIACERLGVPKKTLYDKMRRLGISTEEFK